VSWVRNLHGKDEHGKDLVFYAPVGLDRLRLNACVVKLGKITGSASDPSSGARNVLIQCNQALDTPVLNTQGHEEWVSQVYVMCPNELSPTAMESVSGEFRGRPRQVEFICGHEFLQMFRQCWPGFIFFHPDLLSAHLEALCKELESDTNIHRLATAHGLSALTQSKLGMRTWILELVQPYVTSHTLSDSEKRAGYLIAKLSETFPECKTVPALV